MYNYKRGPAADARKQVYYRLIRRFGFDRVLRHSHRIALALNKLEQP